ncbi:MAG: N-acetylneuraminate synthase family protein [Proteobacteria bacterium]|nr:N-acetylneuraminate synthase family protein [Pseudomonadota bacterium]
MKFANRERPYIIAEIGSNHNGDMALAKELIQAAKDAGADCAKFQSWDTDLWAEEVYAQDKFLSDGREMSESLRSLAELYSVTGAKLEDLRDFCRKVGIDFASSAFTKQQTNDLVDLGAAFIKIASMDVTNDHILTAAGETGLSVVLSTGLASMEEIAHAVATIENTGNHDITILHCVSLYPPPDNAVNLRNIGMLREVFGYPVGFSDHTSGVEIPLAAMALGACVIEKHFTTDKELPGWDHAVSANPDEMRVVCQGAARIWQALGSARREVSSAEVEQRAAFRRSIVVAHDISAGELIGAEDLDFKRPGHGIQPNLASLVVGQRATENLPRDTILKFEHLTRSSD